MPVFVSGRRAFPFSPVITVAFKKSKLPSAHAGRFLSVREAYETVRVRNTFSAYFLGGIAVLAVLGLGSAAFAQIANVKFSIPFPSFSILPSVFNSSSGSDLPTGKFNILITGMGGAAHEGGDLTDTIFLASLNSKTKTVSMLSVPRDLYVDYPTGGKGKVNETYRRAFVHSGKDHEAAMKILAAKVTEITGERVDRTINVDFQAFIRFVDVLGGLDVNVPEDLVDTEYPDMNWGYVTFKVKKGEQTFDGATALKYARSRHSTSDFDRSLRQQILVRAIKEKLLSLGTLSNPAKLQALYSAVSSNVQTDLSFKEMAALALFAKELPSKNILSFNLNDSCFQSFALCDRGGFLYTPARDLFGGASVLLPDGATPSNLSEYRDISRFANLVFNYPEMFLESTEINVVNATKSSGIANKAALFLKKYGFTVPDKDSIGSTKDPYPKTAVLYPWDEAGKTGINPESATLRALGLFIFNDAQSVPANKYAKTPGAKIEIVLGPDYSLFFR